MEFALLSGFSQHKEGLQALLVSHLLKYEYNKYKIINIHIMLIY
jgi:hypothetical protein